MFSPDTYTRGKHRQNYVMPWKVGTFNPIGQSLRFVSPGGTSRQEKYGGNGQ